MEENHNYLPYFYFFFSLLVCILTLTSARNIGHNMPAAAVGAARCTPDSCFKTTALPSIAPLVQDTQANSFKKTAAAKIGLFKANATASISPVAVKAIETDAAIAYDQMSAKSEWWIKRLIYEVRDIAPVVLPAAEDTLLLAEEATPADGTETGRSNASDARIVDGALYINGVLASAEEQQRLGLAVPGMQQVKIVDGKLYINGQLANDNTTAMVQFPDGEIGINLSLLNEQPLEADVEEATLRATAARSGMPVKTADSKPVLNKTVPEVITTETVIEATASDIVPSGIYKPSGSPVSGSMAKVLLADVYAEDIPCYAHYDYNWSTSNIHAYRYDLSKMPETVEFFLTHGLGDDFSIPVGGTVTSGFGPRWGRYHNGVDLDLDTGDGVKAAFDGRVRIAQYSSSYGYVVIVRHFNGLETTYAHLSKLLVSPNQKVKAGDIIALGGSTGRSTGSHLHF